MNSAEIGVGFSLIPNIDTDVFMCYNDIVAGLGPAISISTGVHCATIHGKGTSYEGFTAVCDVFRQCGCFGYRRGCNIPRSVKYENTPHCGFHVHRCREPNAHVQR